MAKDVFFWQALYAVCALNIFSLILSSSIFSSFGLRKRDVNVLFHYNLIGKSNPHCHTNQPMKILLQKQRFKSSNKPVNAQVNILPYSFLESNRKRRRAGGGRKEEGDLEYSSSVK